MSLLKSILFKHAYLVKLEYYKGIYEVAKFCKLKKSINFTTT